MPYGHRALWQQTLNNDLTYLGGAYCSEKRDMLTEPTRDIDACPRAAVVHRESAKK
jgi:hypothetical protein